MAGSTQTQYYKNVEQGRAAAPLTKNDTDNKKSEGWGAKQGFLRYLA